MSRASRAALWVLTVLAAAAAAWAAARLARPAGRPDAAWVRAALTSTDFPAFAGEQSGRLLTPGGWVEVRAQVRHGGGRWRYDYSAGPSAGSSFVLAAEAGQPAVQIMDHADRAIVPGGKVGAPQPTAALLRNYQAVALGTNEVAGRAARVVELRSRSYGTVTARLWLDAQTRLPLRTETCNVDGRLVATSRFTSIRYGGVPDADLTASPLGYRNVPADATVEHAQDAESLRRELTFSPVAPDDLGDGFAAAGTYHYRCRGGNDHAEFRYQDGLRTVCVFEARRRHAHGGGAGMGRGRGLGRGAGPGGGGTDQWGFSDRSGAQVLEWGLTRGVRVLRGDFRVAVIGDLPAAQLSALAEQTAKKLESANAGLVLPQ